MAPDVSKSYSPYFRPDGSRLSSLFLTKESEVYADQVDRLIRATFATETFDRPVYGLRAPASFIGGLSRIAVDRRGQVQGAIRFYRAKLEAKDKRKSWSVLVLGPLSVSQANRGKGLANQLISFSLSEAKARLLGPCFVVGDPKIYRKHGFCNATSLGLKLPNQPDLRRFLVAELLPGKLEAEMRGGTLLPLS